MQLPPYDPHTVILPDAIKRLKTLLNDDADIKTVAYWIVALMASNHFDTWQQDPRFLDFYNAALYIEDGELKYKEDCEKAIRDFLDETR